MKKSFRKVGVAVLAATMIMSMASAVPTFAEGTDVNVTITEANGVTTGTCKMYLVAEVDDLGNWKWNVSGITDKFDEVATYSADQTKTLANKLARAVSDNNLVATGSVGTAMTVTDATANGYYLIVTSTTDAGVVVEPVLKNLKAGETLSQGIKGSEIPFDKKITAVDGDTSRVSASGDTATAANISGGQEVVSYQIMAQVPTYDSNVTGDMIKDFVITDTPSAGLNIDTNTIKVYVSADDKLDSDPELSATVATVGRGFSVTVDGDTIKPATGTASIEGSYVFVTFDGTLNASAKLGKAGNPNDAELEYGNDYSTGKGDGHKDDRVTVFVVKAVLNKLAGDTNAPLKDAEFALYRGRSASGKKIGDFKTGEDGKINFVGLAEGDYYLVETKAPAGYKAVGDIGVHINATKVSAEYNGEFSANNTFRFTGGELVADITDPVVGGLPGTGGMGTMLFTVGGAAVVLMAGVLFVFYMKKKKTEE